MSETTCICVPPFDSAASIGVRLIDGTASSSAIVMVWKFCAPTVDPVPTLVMVMITVSSPS